MTSSKPLAAQQAFADFLKINQTRRLPVEFRREQEDIRKHPNGQVLYVQRTISYESQGERLRSYLLVPRRKSHEVNPLMNAVIVVHTHGSNFETGKSDMVGRFGDYDEAIALDLVKRGYVVLVPDMKGFEERKILSPHDHPEGPKGAVGFDTFVHSLLANGDCYLRYVIEDVMRTVDILQSFAIEREFLIKHIGLMGYSFGGHIVSKTAAFDSRVRATVAFGAIANLRTKYELHSKIDPTERVFNLLKIGDTSDILRLIVEHENPGALLISSSSNDIYAPKSDEVYEQLKPFWEAKGVGQKIGLKNHYQANHLLTPEMKADAYEWFDEQMEQNSDTCSA